VAFTDTVAENGTMTATVVKNPDGSRYPNGPSDIESFAFTAVDVYGLTFAKPPPANNQVADGSTPDQGQAVVTDNGGALKSPVIVKFEFASSTSAKFVVTGDDNIQPGSTATTLYVQTHYDSNLGKNIANASFTDTTAEGVTLKTSLKDYPDVTPKTQDFTFKAVVTHNYALALTDPSPANNQPADGTSADKGQAVVTDNGGALTDPVIVKFECTRGSPKFVLTGDSNIQPGSTAATLDVQTHYDSNLGKDIANASFTDSAIEGVTLKASLRDNPLVPYKTQDFTFGPAGQRFLFLYTTYYYLRVNEDGQTVALVDVESPSDGSPYNPFFIFTAQPYETDGKVQLVNISNDHTTCLNTGGNGLVYAAPLNTAPASQFRLTYPQGLQTYGQTIVIQAYDGTYLYSPDRLTVQTGISDMWDQRCWWTAVDPNIN
jgi:hypothetical protein